MFLRHGNICKDIYVFMIRNCLVTPLPQEVVGKQALVKSALPHKADLWNCTE